MEKLLARISTWIARAERTICCTLTVALVVLILLNVATRAFDIALFWVDELAVYVMIWMALIGGSLILHERGHVTVQLLTEAVTPRFRRYLLLLSDTLVLVFVTGLLMMTWVWFDLAGFSHYGFDMDAFAAETYNFIYQEPTNTLGIKKFWVWLVVPIVSVTMTLHAMARLARDWMESE